MDDKSGMANISNLTSYSQFGVSLIFRQWFIVVSCGDALVLWTEGGDWGYDHTVFAGIGKFTYGGQYH